MALDSIPNQTSILLTDALYDISSNKDSYCRIDKPMERLKRELIKLRSNFSQKLDTIGFQTVLLKANSSFRGRYYYATKPGKCVERIDQWRPYYYFLFGNSQLLNNHELATSLKKLNHVSEGVSYQKFQTYSPAYEVMYYKSSNNTRGTYNTCRGENNCLNGISRDRNNGGFDFLFQVDLSKYVWYDWTDKSQYRLNNENFEVSNIKEIDDPIYSHEFTISTESASIYDRDLQINIPFPSCYSPLWINKSSSDNENNIKGDTQTTWGFNYIVEQIQETYCQEKQTLSQLNFKLLR